MRARFILITIIAAMVMAPATASAQSSYQSWAPEGETPVYSSDIEPFNDSQLSEQSGFVCAFSDGSTLSASDRQALSAIYLAAGSVYNGEWKPNYTSPDSTAISDPDSGGPPPPNGGYPEGKAGMDAFLRDEANLLSEGRWSYPRDRQIQKLGRVKPEGAYSYPKQGWVLVTSQEASTLSEKQQDRLGELIPTDSDHPLELTSTLPEACALTPLAPKGPEFGDLFASPGDFVLSTLLYAPASLASSAHEYLQPYAFKYTFWTPHTERGDLIWDQALSCVPQGDPSRAYTGGDLRSQCDSTGTPLGYDGDVSSGHSPPDNPWFLIAANFLQWLISGVYMLIFLTATILYMTRGSRNTTSQIVRMIPRLMLSVAFVVLAGWVIGGLISASNFAVQAIFSFDDAPTVGAVNTFLLQSGPIVGGSEFFQTLVSLVVGSATVFFYLVFFLTALARQLILVALIILAPLAALAIVVPAWKSKFELYMRALIGVIALPVVMALIMRIGMSINPLITDPESAYGGIKGLLGLALMLVTMWLMWKSISMTRRYIVLGGAAFSLDFSESLGRALSGYSDAQLAAATASGSATALSAPSGMIPSGRETRRGSDAPLINPNQLPPSAPVNSSERGKPLPSPDEYKPIRAREVEEGVIAAHKRVTNEAAQHHKASLKEAIQEAEDDADGELSDEERERIIAEYHEENGRLKKEDGSWYLIEGENALPSDHPEAVAPEVRELRRNQLDDPGKL